MKRSSAKKAAKKLPARKTAREHGTASVSTITKVFPIVAVGASAGGLEASSELLKHISPNLGMAYVFVHHLAPDYASNLSDILQRSTAMPVSRVDDSVLVQPDCVYVIPPNKFISLEAGYLRLSKRSKLDVPYHPIDYFLNSLAHEWQENAIAVLLSGTATDGTLGLKAVKESGGITFAQDKTAKYTQMPRSAQHAGYVDFVLPPERIAQELMTLTHHPYTVVSTENETFVQNEEAIEKILNLILNRRGVDFFSHYKRTTVYRRLMRRMAVLKITEFRDYLKKLKDSDAEVDALYHDFLINVTSFFREPAFYKALVKTVFPQIIRSLPPTEPIRIWIAGCATGEEAYSTAICLTEFLQVKKCTNPVNIFSTDLNGKAIEKARLGIYPKTLVQHLAPQHIKKFFVKLDGHYQVIEPIREMCIFSQHNLLKDPPFSRIDLISCQNVLIYLESTPQRKIFQSFHYALKPQGFLLMGKSESIGKVTDLFEPNEKDSRLFKKKAVAHQRLDFGFRQHPASSATITQATTVRLENDVEKESDKLLLARYVPASVLVNKDLEIIRFRGQTSSFLEPASGKASLNLLKMVKDDLVFDLRAALQQAKKTGLLATQENIVLDLKQERLKVTLEVTPLRSGKDAYFLIVFKEVHEEPATEVKGKPTKQREQTAAIQKLEHALVHAREQIRATSEDFEATSEELQSANEEILSSNEELQSINEELETSKEELQSSNEELTTINEELLNRNVELNQARDYAEAIIETMRGPLMVLNTEMRVRTANRAFYQFFKMSPDKTEGAFIYEIGDRQWNIPALRDQLQDILPQKMAFKDFTISHDFPGIGNRTMIVNAHRLLQDDQGKESLILLSFEDVTRYKNAEQSLRETQEQLKLVLRGASVGTWVWDTRTNEVKVSAEEDKLYGLPEGTSMKTFADWEKTIHPLDRESTRQAIEDSIKNKKPLDIEFRITWPDGNTHWIMAKADTFHGDDGKPEKMMGVNIDITERRTAIQSLAESEKRFHTMSDHAPVMIWMSGADSQITFVNKTWLSFTGKTLEEECGGGWLENIHTEDRENFINVYEDSFREKKEFKIDYRLKRHDGEYRWIMNHGVPRFTGDRFLGFLGTCIDINDRIDLERQKDDFMGIASHELKTPVTSIKAYAQILQEKFRRSNDQASVNMLTRLDLQIDKLARLINTLLDVAKVQSGQMDYFQELFDVKEFITEVTEDMQRAFPTHNIITKVKTRGKVYADKSRLTQVLNNLISNAVKYSPHEKDVIVETSREDDRYIFSVRDFGVGITKEMQNKVFGRFFRVSESSGNRVSGLGLGLFISSQIVMQQGGKLWLESQPGHGSTFYFSLPAKKNHDES